MVAAKIPPLVAYLASSLNDCSRKASMATTAEEFFLILDDLQHVVEQMNQLHNEGLINENQYDSLEYTAKLANGSILLKAKNLAF